MKWRNGMSALIGIWFIIAPWVLGFSSPTAAVWTSVVAGVIQLIASGWATYLKDSSGTKVWQTWVSLLMGIWFILQPFVLTLTTNVAETWSSVILGIITGALNLWTILDKGNASGGFSSSGKTHA
ncbi:MAG: SPW repeat protein [Alicyclobacillus herbarius]|uniref:SPW repeat protein n=1 Tax=Alicyclobacillus herbarius TaxID=122960 RepID=UPI0023566730|nr:SPW repeat protein [Alicyclobacillus herbarius]MCL6632048.1 SPW repeat protein [Alicyclobacillus herbarius]